jgi:hypothetical protein
MNKMLFALVIVFTLTAIIPPAPVHAAGGPPQIPPVDFTCASLNGVTAYSPGIDSTTALKASNCPTVGNWIKSRVNGTTVYINKGIVALYDLGGVSAELARAIVKKLKK